MVSIASMQRPSDAAHNILQTIPSQFAIIDSERHGTVHCNATLDFSRLQRLAARIVCEEVRRPLDQWKPETEYARKLGGTFRL